MLLPNKQRQHRTLHIQKDVLPYALDEEADIQRARSARRPPRETRHELCLGWVLFCSRTGQTFDHENPRKNGTYKKAGISQPGLPNQMSDCS